MYVKPSLVERSLSWLFPIKDMGGVEISAIDLQRRAFNASCRFWGGKSPEMIYWQAEPEYILSDNLKKRKESGLPIPPPICTIG
jgi:hypothetical protein